MNESPARSRGFRTPLITTAASIALLVGLAGCSSASSASTPTPTPNAGAAGCLVSDQKCLGALKPGAYSSVLFDPYATGTRGQLHYTAPEGWANSADFSFQYSLQPADRYLANDKEHWGSVTLLANPAAATQGACDDTIVSAGPATDAAGLAASLAHIPGLTVTTLPSQIVAGRTAVVLETSVDPAAIVTPCRGDNVSLFASRTDGQPWLFSTAAAEGLRIYLVNVDPGYAIAIMVDSPKADFAQLVEAATPLIASFTLVKD